MMGTMTNAQARALRDQGKTPAEILRAAVADGYEYPDAVWRVSFALGLNPAKTEAMEAAYDREKTP